MRNVRTVGRHLALVRLDPEPAASCWFCGRCGQRFEETPGRDLPRVCPLCSEGLLLHARSDAAPDRGVAFVIVDSSLAVQAVSRQAESTLGIREQQAVNRHVTEVLIPGSSEPAAAADLATAITHAAAGDETGRPVAVRPSHTFGVRMQARIAGCGSPRAALIVLDQPVALRSAA